MPSPFQFTPRAIRDLGDIWEYIAEDNVGAANRVESATRFPNFIVVYRPDTKPLQIVAILHGKRDAAVLFEEPASC